ADPAEATWKFTAADSRLAADARRAKGSRSDERRDDGEPALWHVLLLGRRSIGRINGAGNLRAYTILGASGRRSLAGRSIAGPSLAVQPAAGQLAPALPDGPVPSTLRFVP